MPHAAEGFCTIEEAIEELRAGRMIVLVDDEHRENEGDVVIAAEKVTPQAVNFMIRHACGRLCLAMSGPMCDRVGLTPAARRQPRPVGHAVHAQLRRPARHHHRHLGVRPGRQSIQTAIDDRSTPHDLVFDKGHLDGLRARDGGVLVRAGHTEGSVDLARLAGLKSAAVICEVVREDGYMARLPDLKEFCAKHGLKMCTIADLIKYRRHREKLVKRETRAQAARPPTGRSTCSPTRRSSIRTCTWP